MEQDDYDLEQGYRDMAADHEREAEALEWSEVLIGDVFVSEIAE